MTKMTVWNNFPDTYCCPYFIEPTEDLFQTVGKMFIEEVSERLLYLKHNKKID